MTSSTGSALRPTSETLVYLPRDYPSLSQTFIRHEVEGLRRLGFNVEVTALRHSLTENVDESEGRPDRVARRLPWGMSIRDSLFWLVAHPSRFVRLWSLVAQSPGGSRWMAVRFMPTYARALRDRGVFAVHTHFAFAHAWSTLYLATLLGTPATITVHAADIYADPDDSVRLLNRFDLVVNVCRYNETLLRSHGLTSRTAVVPCGVELPALRSDRPRPAGTSLVSVGRLVPKKGFAGLLRAMPLVIDEVPTATLDIIGGGELQDELQILADQLKLGPHVRFHGPQPNEAVLDAIDRADVFVLNCAVPPDGNTDAMPVVLREAMARECPTVTTAVAGIPESLDETCGWVVAPGDIGALARAMTDALTSPRSCDRARAGRARIEQHFTLLSCVSALASALKSLTPSSPQ